MLEWITVKSFGLFCPYIADVFVRREALEGFKPAGEVIGLVRDHIFHGRQDARQSNGSVDIGALPGGDIQSQRSAFHIVDGVELGVAPAPADADGFKSLPFLPPPAKRWALIWVLSMAAISASSKSVPTILRYRYCQIPRFDQRL